jgi:hypothetical protein
VPLPVCFQLSVDLCCNRVFATLQCHFRLQSCSCCFTVLWRLRAPGGLAAVNAGFSWRV